MAAHRSLLEQVKLVIPRLRPELHKGECGRIGVIGGSAEYTGAPYFSAIAAMKTGADIVHVFCTKMAAIPIKSYHPDLIVHPLLPSRSEAEDQQGAQSSKASSSSPSSAVDAISQWLPRLHTLIIGPGLGRDQVTLDCTLGVIANAKERKLPLIIDADGLFLVSQHPEILKDYPLVTLTPNGVEFKRLQEIARGEHSFLVPTGSGQDPSAVTGLTVVQKGTADQIINHRGRLECSEPGSNRRCGGQGDILSGMLATFTNWSLKYYEENANSSNLPAVGPQALAAFGACALVRRAGQLTFAKHGRAMTSHEVVSTIHEAFESLFPESE